MSNFSFIIGQKVTTNNGLILEVAAHAAFPVGDEEVEVYVSKAVGRTGGSNTEPTRPLPQNLFFHRADGVRLKQQGEDGETNIVEPASSAPTRVMDSAPVDLPLLLCAEVGDRVVTVNGLVLEITSVDRDSVNALVFSSRAVGRTDGANQVNFGRALPRNAFKHNRDGDRIGDYSPATDVVRTLTPYETLRDFRPLMADEAPAARVLGDGLSA